MNNSVDVKVLSLLKYGSFKDMLDNEGLTNCLPDTANIKDGVAIYDKYYATSANSASANYTTLARKLGVIALRITTDLTTATPVPRPLIIIRGGKPSHILTKQEFDILHQTKYRAGSADKQNLTTNIVAGHAFYKRTNTSVPMTTFKDAFTQANVQTTKDHKRCRSRSRE